MINFRACQDVLAGSAFRDYELLYRNLDDLASIYEYLKARLSSRTSVQETFHRELIHFLSHVLERPIMFHHDDNGAYYVIGDGGKPTGRAYCPACWTSKSRLVETRGFRITPENGLTRIPGGGAECPDCLTRFESLQSHWHLLCRCGLRDADLLPNMVSYPSPSASG